MTYGYQVAPRRSGMTTAGKWMFIIGLVLSLITIGVMIWGGVNLARMLEAMERDSVSLSSPQTVSMETGETRFVIADSTAAAQGCTVERPDGTTASLDTSDLPETGDGTSTVAGSFTADDPGQYTFSCQDNTVSLSGPIGMGAVIGIAAVGLGLLALLPLGLITIIGLILWLVGRSRDKKALEAPVGPGGPYGYGNPNYPQPGQPSNSYGQPYPGQGGYSGEHPYPQAGDQGYGQSGSSSYGQPGASAGPSDYGQPGYGQPTDSQVEDNPYGHDPSTERRGDQGCS